MTGEQLPPGAALAVRAARAETSTWSGPQRRAFRNLVLASVPLEVRRRLGGALRPDVADAQHPANWRAEDLPAAFAYLVPAFLPLAEVRTAVLTATSRRRPTVPQLRRVIEGLVLEVQRLERRLTDLEARAWREHGEED